MRIRLGKPIALRGIAFAMSGKFSYGHNPLIENITTDSRTAIKGDLYIPIRGNRFNGEDFVKEIIKSGCYTISSVHEEAHIQVKDTSRALLDFATYYNKNLPYILYRIGITGSVGKTTTKEFAKILLSAKYKTHANEGNFNNGIGLPMSILSAPRDSELLIMEMGMNHQGEISQLSECLCPDLAVITNIGTSHIGNLGSRENIARAKLEIECGMADGKVYVPAEEQLLTNAKNKVTLSLTDKSADFYLESIGGRVAIYKQGEKYAEANFAFSEEHLKKCLLFACAIAIDSGIPPALLSDKISIISTDNIRQKMFSIGKYIFYADYYNASPESILSSFDSVKSAKNLVGKSLLLGDVLELGDKSEEIHYGIGQSIPKGLFKSIFLFGNFAEHTARGAVNDGFPMERIHINTDLSRPEITALQINEYCDAGELILMKASRGVKLERVLDFFKERS